MQKSNFLKKISLDMLLNISSYGLPIIVLQFLVLPVMARYLGSEDYGLMLTLTSIISIAGEMAGGTIANVRLIFDLEYKKRNLNGDYKQIVSGLTVVGIVILSITLSIAYRLAMFQIVLLLCYFAFFSFRSYYTVGYRLELKYNLVFINNLILCVGYGFGLVISYHTKKWEYVYIIGFALSSFHMYFTTRIRYDSWKRTELFKPVLQKTVFLMFAYLIGNSMNYFDRVLLYPIVGGSAVSEYYVATVFGKVLNLLITPINMVVLSYLSKKEYITQKEVFACMGGLTILGSLFVASAGVAAPLVLRLLYPDYVDRVLPLVPIATCAAVLMACTSLFKTLSMRFVSEKNVFATETIYIIIYIIVSIFLLNRNGLIGFCIATVCASIIRFLLFLFGLINICKNKQK